MKQPKPYLRMILAGIEAIESYQPASEAAFMADPMRQDAILMRLQDIGECLSHLRDGFPDLWDKYAEASWSKAVGLRNIISHAYGEIKLDIIWALISEDLKPLKQSIEKLL